MQKTDSGIVLPHRFTPRPYQQEVYAALDSGYKFAFMRWSRRAGKDKTSWNYMVKRAAVEVGVYFYFFPTFAQGRKAIWETIQDGMKILDHIPPELVAKKNNNEMKVELVNGSIIRIVGTDQFDAIMGTNPIGVVFSEYSLQNPKAWEFIQPILIQNKGWAIFNGTPRGKNHMYDMEVNAVKNPNEWFVSVIQSLNPDLPNYYEVVTQADLEQVRASGTTEDVIASEYGVSYSASPEGTYYADLVEKARKQGRIGMYPHNDHLWVDTFWDIGRNDSTVIWFRQQQGDRLIWIDCLEDSSKSPGDYVQMLAERGYKYKTHYLPHDAAHKRFEGCAAKVIQACLMSAGLSDDVAIAERPLNKMMAINAVRARFSRYFFNEPLTADAILKLALYHRKYDPTRRVFLDVPIHDWCSHTADALSTEALTADVNEVQCMSANINIISEFDPIDDDNL